MANSGWLYISEDKVVENAIDTIRNQSIHSTMTDEPYFFYGFEKFMGREISFNEYQENHESLVVYLPRYELCSPETKSKKVNYFVHPFAWLGRGKVGYVDKYYKDYDKVDWEIFLNQSLINAVHVIYNRIRHNRPHSVSIEIDNFVLTTSEAYYGVYMKELYTAIGVTKEIKETLYVH